MPKIFLDLHESPGQKNGVKKRRENFFEEFHEYREQKNGGKMTRENF